MLKTSIKTAKILMLIGFGIYLIGCQSDTAGTALSTGNTDKQDDFVGITVCKSCHADQYESYSQTGMGRSFGPPTTAFSQAIFSPDALVYDTINDLYYRPFLQQDSIYIQEFRLRGSDTIHERTEKVDFVIGSGHHTHSHLIWRNGYLYQAPITFYAQEQRWDLAPGFEKGNNQRFNRWIGAECVTCHNHYPQQVAGSEHKYEQIPLGIECERCHGPGRKHVDEKLAGKTADNQASSIINPRNLPIERQMDICQRCHLQGIAVLKPEKSFYDFNPGMQLSDVLDVYLPRFTDSDEHFIMASQADRLRLSPCFLESGQLSCITCHNPHHNVHSTDKNRYNSSCLNCHNAQSTQSKLQDCSVDLTLRETDNNNNCVNCHLPRSGSIDIPHITISDHNIARSTARPPLGRPIDPKEKDAVARFLGIENLTNPNASDLDYAKGYLYLYDKFIPQSYVLDSAWLRLQNSTANQKEKMPLLVHYHFARQQYPALIKQVKDTDANSLSDAWTAYRIGEAYLALAQPDQALAFLDKAQKLLPHFMDFKEKWALALAQNNNIDQAEEAFKEILKQEPQRPLALTNLGFISAQKGNNPLAIEYYNKALQSNPNYEAAALNKSALLIRLGTMDEARLLLQQLLLRNPKNTQALQLLKTIR